MAEERDSDRVVERLKWQLKCLRFFKFETPEAQAAFKAKHFISSEKWEDMERYAQELSEREERQSTEKQMEAYQEAAINEAADKFVDVHFKGATREEKNLITDQLAREILAPDADHDFTVEEMVERGLPGVRSKHRRRHLKHLRHSWTAIKGLVGLVAVLAIYNKVNTTFEVVVFSLLVLLYIHSTRYLSSGLLAIADANCAGYVRYLGLASKIDKEKASSAEYEGLWTLEKQLQKGKIDHYVRDTCNTLVTLVVFWNIFKVL